MDLYPSDEKSLIAGCKKNESPARRKLYELYAPAMLGICVRYLNDKEKAKDVLHEGFITVFTKISTYSGKGSFEGWMRRVFVTKAIEFLRSDRLRRQTDSIEYEEKIDPVENSAVEKLSAEEILKCISELPKGCRIVFNMFAIEGYSHAEIANALNINEGTSRSQFAHARQLLQIKIQKLNFEKDTKNKYG
jgi:RNA polymerase sigma-70 factor (ECF subfamily)